MALIRRAGIGCHLRRIAARGSRQLLDRVEGLQVAIGLEPEIGETTRRRQHLPFERSDRAVVGLDARVEAFPDLAEMRTEDTQASIQILAEIANGLRVLGEGE